MKLATMLSLPVLAGFASLALAADDPRCLAEYKAEEARIMRDAEQAAKANPPGRDLKAQQQLMTPVHDALKAAGEKADKCNRDARSAAYRDNQAAIDLRTRQCTEKADRQLDEMRKRSAGRAGLSRDEQIAQRSAQDRILDERMDCLRKVQ